MEATVIPVHHVRFRWSWGIIFQRLGLLIFLFIVLGPLLSLIIQTVPALFRGHSDWLSLAVPAGRRLILLLHSLGFAAAVAVTGVIIGTLGGLILWRWDNGWRAYLRWLVIILAPIPPYIHALAWTSTLYAINNLLQRLGLAALPLQGWPAAWWVQVMSLAPIAIGLALVGFKSVEPMLIDAARVQRPDVSSLTRIVLPLAAPALLAGGGVLFLLSLIDYSVPSLFNLNVYSLEIFADFSAANEPVRAFILSLPMLIIAVVVILFSLTAIRNAASSPSWRIPAWKTAPEWPGWLTYLQWLAIAIFIVQIGVPLVSLASSIGEWNNLVTTVATAHREIFFSFWINIAAALLCVPLAVATARELVYVKKWEKLLWVLVIIPLAIPPSLTGIGLITIWNQPQIHGVYGSSLMPILAGISRFAPLAVIVMVAQFRRLDPMLIDAARVLRTSGWQMWRQIWLPMLAPGLLAAAGIVFALNLGELGATLLVAPPGQATLTIRIYNFLHYGASGTVAGLCLLMAAAILIAGAIAALMLIKWSDISSKITVRRK